MKKYKIKGSDTQKEFLTVLKESENQLRVLLEKVNPYGIEAREEDIPKDLFETCLRTNYFTELVAI